MHGHEAVPPWGVEIGNAASLLAAAIVLFVVIYLGDRGFQSLHPADQTDGGFQ